MKIVYQARGCLAWRQDMKRSVCNDPTCEACYAAEALDPPDCEAVNYWDNIYCSLPSGHEGDHTARISWTG